MTPPKATESDAALRSAHALLALVHEQATLILAPCWPDLARRHRWVADVCRAEASGQEPAPPPNPKPRRRKKGSLRVIPGGAA